MPKHRIPSFRTGVQRTIVLVSLMFHASGSSADWLFLPAGGRSLTLVANPEEPRAGLQKEWGTSRMRLDIGVGTDLCGFDIDRDKSLRLGASLFTYALTTSNEGLRLQVDAVDGFFGGYLTFLHSSGSSDLFVRFRILHRSAHFVDGHIDNGSGRWEAGRGPVPYSKDFGELVASYEWDVFRGRLRVYSGISYATLVRPDDLRKLGSLHGIEWHTDDSSLAAWDRPVNVYGAYHFVLEGIPTYVGNNTMELGVRFGSWKETGIRLFLSYRAGMEVFGQYYDRRREYLNVGFSIDLR